MNYKLKPIVWKEYPEVTIGYVGGLKMFSIRFMPDEGNGRGWTLMTKLPYPKMSFWDTKECQEVALSLLQKFAAAIVQ